MSNETFDEMIKGRRMTQLTTQKAKDWRTGRHKYAYTNIYPKCKGLTAVSGCYAYFIDFTGPPEVISYNKVPKGYKMAINPDKIIYRIPAKLVSIMKRKGMK